jgi:hypothetical protein
VREEEEEEEEEERQAARERVYAAFGGKSHIDYGRGTLVLVGADGGTQGSTVVSGVVSTNAQTRPPCNCICFVLLLAG